MTNRHHPAARSEAPTRNNKSDRSEQTNARACESNPDHFQRADGAGSEQRQQQQSGWHGGDEQPVEGKARTEQSRGAGIFRGQRFGRRLQAAAKLAIVQPGNGTVVVEQADSLAGAGRVAHRVRPVVPGEGIVGRENR